MFRKHLERQAMAIAALDEVKSGRRRQRANARKPRPDALQTLILQIMKRNPAIPPDGLLAELRKYEHGDVIDTFNDEESVIDWHNKAGRVFSAPCSGLKDRMSRARKNLRSR